MSNKEKRAKFRELAKHDRIRTATQLDEELAAPFLPFNEFKARVSYLTTRIFLRLSIELVLGICV